MGCQGLFNLVCILTNVPNSSTLHTTKQLTSLCLKEEILLVPATVFHLVLCSVYNRLLGNNFDNKAVHRRGLVIPLKSCLRNKNLRTNLTDPDLLKTVLVQLWKQVFVSRSWNTLLSITGVEKMKNLLFIGRRLSKMVVFVSFCKLLTVFLQNCE